MERKFQLVTQAIASLVVFLGILIIIAWYTHTSWLIQISDQFSPMQFNTAVCCLFAGLSLLFLQTQYKVYSRICSIIVLILAGMTLLQYVLKINLGIDQLFINGYIQKDHPFPGRMAPNAAVGFNAIALTLLLLSFKHTFISVIASLVMMFLVASIVVVTALGYSTHLTTSYGFGQSIRMAVLTALGLLLLAVGIIVYLRSYPHPDYYVPFLPLLMTFIILIITFLSWQVIKKSQQDNLKRLLILTNQNIRNVIQTYMGEQANSFQRLTYHWAYQKGIPANEWHMEVSHYLADQPGFQVIEYVDKNYIVRLVEPELDPKWIIGVNFKQDAYRRALILKTLETKSLQLSNNVDLIHGGKGLLLLSPIFYDHAFQGLMVGIINPQHMLDYMIKKTNTTQDYVIHIYDDNELLYANANSTSIKGERWTINKTISVYGQSWTISVSPTVQLYQKIISPIFPLIALFIGIMIALLTGTLVHTLQVVKRHAAKINKMKIKLAHSSECLQAIIESSDSLIAAIDFNYHLIAFNTIFKNEMYRLFEVNFDVGTDLKTIFAKMDQENATKVQRYWERALQGETFTLIENLTDKLVISLEFETRYSPIFDVQGNIIGASYIASNVHERLLNQKNLAQSKSTLEKLVINLEKQNKELELLKEMINLLQSSISLEAAFEIIEVYLKKILPGIPGNLYLSSPNNNKLFEKVLSWKEPISSVDHLYSADCLAIIRHQNHYVVQSEADILCRHIKNNKPWPNSYVCFPLFVQNEILGLLYIECALYEKDNRRVISLAQIISEQIALSLFNIRLREQLKSQSTHDTLTGLYNRGFFEEYMSMEMIKLQRSPATFALAMIDVDHFKMINDNYGHLIGDQVLIKVSKKLSENIRHSDVVARWGGEEFLVFLRDATLEGAKLRAESIRASIENLVIDYNGKVLTNLTISIGLAFYPVDGTSFLSLISQADTALYKAKQLGRNRVYYD